MSNVIRLSSSFANDSDGVAGSVGPGANHRLEHDPRDVEHDLEHSQHDVDGRIGRINPHRDQHENMFAIRPASVIFLQEDEMLEELDRRDRMRLVQFVCSFAWADLEIQPEERVFISRLIRRLDLGEAEDLQVQQWLDRPPELDDLDPTSIPGAHKRFFVEAIEGLISADGEIAEEERDSFEIFKQLLAN